MDWWAKGWVDGRCVTGGMGGWCDGWIGRQRKKVRGVYGFSSLVKQNKKGKNYAVFCFAEKKNY